MPRPRYSPETPTQLPSALWRLSRLFPSEVRETVEASRMAISIRVIRWVGLSDFGFNVSRHKRGIRNGPKAFKPTRLLPNSPMHVISIED
ncbi:hypothetical protein K1719_028238 [Acacia pycnantha]|nr:hypothetical protein K1719_028238 [Acacia pycnantha]